MDNASIDGLFRRMYTALVESLERGEGGPFAASVVVNGRAVSIGTNTVIRSFDVSRHAEINALAEAGRRLERCHLHEAVLLTTHYPCLMCYNALKWAGIPTAYYLFDYEETERLFGFSGDSRLLKDLSLTSDTLDADPSVDMIRYRSPLTDRLFAESLVRRWREEFEPECEDYDIV